VGFLNRTCLICCSPNNTYSSLTKFQRFQRSLEKAAADNSIRSEPNSLQCVMCLERAPSSSVRGWNGAGRKGASRLRFERPEESIKVVSCRLQSELCSISAQTDGAGTGGTSTARARSHPHARRSRVVF